MLVTCVAPAQDQNLLTVLVCLADYMRHDAVVRSDWASTTRWHQRTQCSAAHMDHKAGFYSIVVLGGHDENSPRVAIALEPRPTLAALVLHKSLAAGRGEVACVGVRVRWIASQLLAVDIV